MGTPVLEYRSAGEKAPFPWREFRRFLWLIVPLLLLEIGAARLAFHTVGEMESACYYALVCVNVLPVGMWFVSRRSGVVLALVLALLIVPYQIYLGVRWWRVHAEAERIVEYVTAHPAQTGSFPADLSGYAFRDAGTEPFINYSPRGNYGAGHFRLDYHVGTPMTSHWHDPNEGWLYYPD